MKKKIIFLSKIFVSGLVVWASIYCTPVPTGGTGDCTTGENVAQFGIRKIDNVPGWCNSGTTINCPFQCEHEPNDIYYRSGATLESNVDLQKLVDDAYKPIPTNNPKNWWIECGWSGNQFCVDNDFPEMIDPNGQCLNFRGVSRFCSITYWIQVVSECDDCVKVNGFPQVGGTWWKWQKTIAPDEFPQNCNIDTKGQVQLTLQSVRTDCFDMDYPWGCGPNENQD
jgi:hypothetical protein